MTVAAMCAAAKNVFGHRNCAQAELPPIFDAVEHALDDVAGFVEFGVVLELYLAVPARWGLASASTSQSHRWLAS